MEREKDSKVMCKGPVVRGNMAPSWDGEKPVCPVYLVPRDTGDGV